MCPSKDLIIVAVVIRRYWRSHIWRRDHKLSAYYEIDDQIAQPLFSRLANVRSQSDSKSPYIVGADRGSVATSDRDSVRAGDLLQRLKCRTSSCSCQPVGSSLKT